MVLSTVVAMAGSAGALRVMFDQVRRLSQPDSSCLFLFYHRSEGPAYDWGRLLPEDSGYVAKPMRPGLAVAPRSIYYPTSGDTYAVRQGRLVRTEGPRHPRPHLDTSLQTIAAEYGPRVLAVLLSGWGRDGVAGIRAVGLAGGTVIVQDPATAEASQLPRNALAGGGVDHVMEPPEIVAEVRRALQSGSASVAAAERAG